MRNWKKGAALALTTCFVVAGSFVSYAGTWQQNSQGWWYDNEDGTYPTNTWFKDPATGKWYHFDGLGYMQTGWFTENNGMYYLGADGAMYANTQAAINGEIYTFDASGRKISQTTTGGTQLADSTKEKLGGLIAYLDAGIGLNGGGYAFIGDTKDISFDKLMAFAGIYLNDFHDKCGVAVTYGGEGEEQPYFTVAEADMNAFFADALGIDLQQVKGKEGSGYYADGVYKFTYKAWDARKPYATVDRVKIVSSGQYQLNGRSGWAVTDENGNTTYKTAPYTIILEKNVNNRFDGYTVVRATYTYSE